MQWTTLERLRIYMGENDRHEGKPTHEHLVRRASESGLAGATVLRGMMGYGGHKQIHTAKILVLSGEMPVIVEIIDRAGKLEDFCRENEAALSTVLVTRDSVSAWVREQSGD
ncbi:DUF190 domain-containing protein [Fundidesulfovibrio soli]|uniref:DUF190 domain-containing protein n=1 Tax=Fundidesulfovibrio soli TaxID=2922716 RepID=UPI001FAEB893|nr:DUF190 domain-containing protein [Fundidesulfovibrio soli]